MKSTFEYIAQVLNERPEDSKFTLHDLKAQCKNYYQQVIPVGTFNTYMIKLIACGYVNSTGVRGVYSIFKRIPEGYTSADIDAEWKATLAEKNPTTALDVQIGGNHYKKYAYQPIEFAVDANLSYIHGAIIKYIVRYEDKNGVEDIKKVIHYCELAIELKHTPKLKDFYYTYLHRFCVKNKLSALQAEVVKKTVVSDYKSIINICKTLC